jgi:hypothetical protein
VLRSIEQRHPLLSPPDPICHPDRRRPCTVGTIFPRPTLWLCVAFCLWRGRQQSSPAHSLNPGSESRSHSHQQISARSDDFILSSSRNNSSGLVLLFEVESAIAALHFHSIPTWSKALTQVTWLPLVRSAVASPAQCLAWLTMIHLSNWLEGAAVRKNCAPSLNQVHSRRCHPPKPIRPVRPQLTCACLIRRTTGHLPLPVARASLSRSGGNTRG